MNILESEDSDDNEKKIKSKLIVQITLFKYNFYNNFFFFLEPILASDEISRAQSLDELHTRLAAIRGKNSYIYLYYLYRFLVYKVIHFYIILLFL